MLFRDDVTRKPIIGDLNVAVLVANFDPVKGPIKMPCFIMDTD